MKKFAQIYPLVIVLISLAIGTYLSPQLPNLMASHWNASGQVDGYMSKNMGIFFMPFLTLFLYFLFRFLPSTDPYKKNFSQFENYFYAFIVVIFSFFFYLYLLTLAWNLGFLFNLVQFLSPAFAILFYYCGVLIQKSRRNWFVGIRTPWTMSSDFVWQKTHQLGAKLFKISSLLILLSIFWPDYSAYLLLIPVIISTITVFVYSYYVYHQLDDQKDLH